MSTARWNQKEAGGKHSKEEYDNRIMEANATNVGAKKREKMCLHIHAKKHGTLLLFDRISEQLRRELLGLRGFSSQNIRNMRSFYEYWRQYIICSPLASKLQKCCGIKVPYF